MQSADAGDGDELAPSLSVCHKEASIDKFDDLVASAAKLLFDLAIGEIGSFSHHVLRLYYAPPRWTELALDSPLELRYRLLDSNARAILQNDLVLIFEIPRLDIIGSTNRHPRAVPVGYHLQSKALGDRERP